MVKKKYYKRWFEKDSILNYKDKKFSDFFLSEKYLLKKIQKNNIRSILDIGCASGRYRSDKKFFQKLNLVESILSISKLIKQKIILIVNFIV